MDEGETDGCCLEAEKSHYIKSHCLSALGNVVSLFVIAKKKNFSCRSQLGESFICQICETSQLL